MVERSFLMTTVAKKLASIKPGTLLAGVDLSLDSRQGWKAH
jgi:hypothetical protein